MSTHDTPSATPATGQLRLGATLYLGTHNVGSFSGPKWVGVVINAEFLKALEDANKLAGCMGWEHIQVQSDASSWDEDESRFDNPCDDWKMRVSSDSFHLIGLDRDHDEIVETSYVNTEKLLACLKLDHERCSGDDLPEGFGLFGDAILHGQDVDELIEYLKEDHHELAALDQAIEMRKSIRAHGDGAEALEAPAAPRPQRAL